MFNLQELSPELRKELCRNLSANDVLFKQGDHGKTMYFVVDGYVKIYYEVKGAERPVAIVGPSEIIGEKAILDDAPYIRSFSAKTKTDSTLLEVNAANYKVLQKKFPDITLIMLGQVLGRLNKANELIAILQLTDPILRFYRYTQYYQKHHRSKVPPHFVVPLTVEEVQGTVNLTEQLAKDSLEDLVNQQICKKEGYGYFLRDESALQKYIAKRYS